jgi:hypothetical protein
MKIEAAQRLMSTAELAYYLTSAFYADVKYWVQPLGRIWEPRLHAYNKIARAGIPKQYRQSNVCWRGIGMTGEEFLRQEGDFTFDKPTSWTKHEITPKTRQIGWLRIPFNYREVKSYDLIPETHRKHALTFVIFKKKIPASQVVLDIDSMFLDPEYKVALKKNNPKITLTDTLFKRGWMGELIVKPGYRVTHRDILFQKWFVQARSDAEYEADLGRIGIR